MAEITRILLENEALIILIGCSSLINVLRLLSLLVRLKCHDELPRHVQVALVNLKPPARVSAHLDRAGDRLDTNG